MSAASPRQELATGGNVRGWNSTHAFVGLVGRRKSLYTFFHGCQTLGFVLVAVAFVWYGLHVSYQTWSSHIAADSTRFNAVLHGVPVVPMNMPLWVSLLGIGILSALGGAFGKDRVVQSTPGDTVVLWGMIIMMLGAMALPCAGIVALTGIITGAGNQPQDAQLRVAADKWIAEHVNTQQPPFRVAFQPGSSYDPVFLRSLNPDGSLHVVYQIVSNGTQLSVTPVK